MPSSTTGELLIKSESAFSLDRPSHLYSLPYLLSTNTNVNLNTSLTTLSNQEDTMRYSSEYPICSATVKVTQVNPIANFNNTDYIRVEGLVNGNTIDSADFYEFSTTHTIIQTLELPLKLFEGTNPSIGFNVEFQMNPDENMTLEEYEIASDYLVEITDIRISGMNQQIELLNQDHAWTYLNGTSKSVSTIQTDFGMSDDAMSFTSDLFEQEVTTSEINIQINKNCINPWSPTVQEITVDMDLTYYYTFITPICIESYHYNLTVMDTNGNDKVSIASGFKSDESWAKNSDIRAALYYTLDNSGEILNIQDALSLNLNQNQYQEITLSSLYLPYKGSLDWTFVLPNLNQNFAQLESMTLQVDVSIGDEQIKSLVLDQDSLVLQDGKYVNNSISVDFPSQYYSKFLDLHINFTLTGCANVSAIFLDAAIVGEENIIQMSNVYPDELRARLYSTNFLYYYTQNAFKLGATAIKNNNFWDVNDLYYALEKSPAEDHVLDLDSILNVFNWSVYYSDNLTYYIIDTEEELLELFNHNTNFATACEMSETGKSMLKMKFQEPALAAITQPQIYSGILALYDLNANGAATQLTTRKITVMINPTVWERQPTYLQLKTTAANPEYSTLLSAEEIDLGQGVSSERLLNLDYFLNPGSQDLVIDDFSVEVKTPTSITSYYDLLDVGTNPATTLDGGYIGFTIPTSTQIYSYVLDVSKLSRASSVWSFSTYEYIKLGLYLENTSYVNQISIGTHVFPVTGSYFSLNSSSYFERSEFPTDQITIKIQFNGTSVPDAHRPYLLLQSLEFYDESSVGSIKVATVYGGSPLTYEAKILPTPFTPHTSKETLSSSFNLQSGTGSEYLTKLTICTPSNPDSTLNLLSISLMDDYTRINASNHEILQYYTYDFDAYSRNIMEVLSYGFARPQPSWNAFHIHASETPMLWSKSIVYDLDNDGQSYEYLKEYFDGEGTGEFSNNIDDLVVYDFTNDGSPDLVEKWETTYQTTNVSAYETYPFNEFSNFQATFLTQIRTTRYTMMMDTTGDGFFDSIESSEEMVSLKTAIPNYRAMTFDTKAGTIQCVNYFKNTPSDSDWSSPINQITIQYDYDGDQVMDYILTRQDLFPNTATVLASQNEDLIYETYYEAVLVEDEYVVSSGNELAQQLAFVVAGADDISGWTGQDDGTVRNVMKGTFIVIENTPVLVDPRFNIEGVSPTIPNGVVAWYDSNSDGYCELGFIFTARSWQDKVAVAVYLSKSGTNELYTTEETFISSNDELVASHWLSDDSSKYLPQTDVWKLGYDTSLINYENYINSQIYRNNLIADGIAAFVIGVIGGFVGATSCGLLAGTVILGLNVLYQVTIKPALNEKWDDELGSELIHELGKAPITDNQAAIGNAWTEYLGSWGHWGIDDWPLYESAAYFSDINPFTYDLYKGTWIIDSHPDAQVWVPVTIPQIWYPDEDNWVAAAKFWISKEDPNYFAYCDGTLDNPLYDYLYAYLGDVHPSYAQYLEAKAHVLQRYYYRDDPTDAIMPVASLSDSESSLRISASYKTYLDYTTIKISSDRPDQLGRPALTALTGTKPFLNYSDPVAYYVDYLEMCLLSRYQTGYESCQLYNPQIAKHQLRDTVILTAAGVLGCFVGSTFGTMVKSVINTGTSLGFSQTFQQIMTSGSSGGLSTGGKVLYGIGKFSWQMLDEMVLEQITSEGLQLFGVNVQWAELAGESYGMGSVIESITSSIQSSEGSMAATKQQGDQYTFQTATSTTLARSPSAIVRGIQYLHALRIGIKTAACVQSQSLNTRFQVQTMFNGFKQSGGGVNLQQLITIGEQLGIMSATDYDAAQLPLWQLQSLLRGKMMAVIEECITTDSILLQSQILYKYLIGAGVEAKLGLIEGRYQVLRLHVKSPSGFTETITLTTLDQNGKDVGTVLIQRADGNLESLSDFIRVNDFGSLIGLFARSSSYTMIDPIKSKTDTWSSSNQQSSLNFDMNHGIIYANGYHSIATDIAIEHLENQFALQIKMTQLSRVDSFIDHHMSINSEETAMIFAGDQIYLSVNNKGANSNLRTKLDGKLNTQFADGTVLIRDITGKYVLSNDGWGSSIIVQLVEDCDTDYVTRQFFTTNVIDAINTHPDLNHAEIKLLEYLYAHKTELQGQTILLGSTLPMCWSCRLAVMQFNELVGTSGPTIEIAHGLDNTRSDYDLPLFPRSPDLIQTNWDMAKYVVLANIAMRIDETTRGQLWKNVFTDDGKQIKKEWESFFNIVEEDYNSMESFINSELYINAKEASTRKNNHEIDF